MNGSGSVPVSPARTRRLAWGQRRTLLLVLNNGPFGAACCLPASSSAAPAPAGSSARRSVQTRRTGTSSWTSGTGSQVSTTRAQKEAQTKSRGHTRVFITSWVSPTRLEQMDRPPAGRTGKQVGSLSWREAEMGTEGFILLVSKTPVCTGVAVLRDCVWAPGRAAARRLSVAPCVPTRLAGGPG